MTNIYDKLNAARIKFHTLQLKKTGLNKFAGYSYFELGDFLVPAMNTLAEFNLCAYISFGKELATMRIVDILNPAASIEITSPMSTAALKGCHEVQNLGAVQTYLRRYLWVTALEIVEHDALDSSEGVAAKIIHAPTGVPLVSPNRMSIIADAADYIKERHAANDLIAAYEQYQDITDEEEKTALWKLLSSTVRSAIKKHGESLKPQKA